MKPADQAGTFTEKKLHCLADYSSSYFSSAGSNTGVMRRVDGRVFRRGIGVIIDMRAIRTLWEWRDRDIVSGPLTFLWCNRTQFICPEQVRYVAIVKTNSLEFVKSSENLIQWQDVKRRK